MLSKSRIQFIQSLQQKKFRELNGSFVVEGPKMVSELLESKFETQLVLATGDWVDANKKNIPKSVETSIVTEKELERISGLKTPNQVVAMVKKPELDPDFSTLTKDYLLMLDGISDPGNLGTIIRTADWFGIKTIICSQDTVEVFNPKVVQSTMGSLFRVGVYYHDPVRFLEEISEDVPTYGAFLDGNNIYKEKFKSKGIIVIGSESHGIRKELEMKIKNRLHIPSLASRAESLNASVAASIFCSEIRRSDLANV